MFRHVGLSFAAATGLIALCLTTPGCSQSGSSDDQVSETTVAPEPEASEAVEPAESEVKLARAESRIQPPGEEPAEPVDPRLEPPAKLPTAVMPLPLDNVDAADLTMPTVSLTEHHAATCKVGVGDAFPDLQLPDMAGRQQSLSKLFGDKLTLVVFWNGQEPTAREELADLARYLHPRFGDRGMAIVAVNTGDDAQLAAELAQQPGAEFPILSDADGAAFKQVATDKLPRSYLLDPSGTVLWFDLEYSPTTLRDMVQAIRYSLSQE